tara:strand:+ start:228 stop:524 length:297 start_codon:yes stop_codon:yes gene_type:complete
MCGGRSRGTDNSESIALQKESLALSREQFDESKRQWGEQFSWQKAKAEEQKRAAEARAGKGPTRTTEYAMGALEGRAGLGFGRDRLKKDVTGKGLAIV